MRVFLSGISDEPKEFQFAEHEPWVAQVMRDVQESPAEQALPAFLRMELYRNEDLVFLKGHFKGALNLICSRCANAFHQPLTTSFQCLFTRDRALEESDTSIIHNDLNSDEDIDIEFLDREYIELADVLKEQLYLKMPVQPLCDPACKGLCPTCGQNKNTNPCQCHRLNTGTLANALKNFRVS